MGLAWELDLDLDTRSIIVNEWVELDTDGDGRRWERERGGTSRSVILVYLSIHHRCTKWFTMQSCFETRESVRLYDVEADVVVY